MQALEGQRVIVMGLGRFGGGVGVARFLAQAGADVLVTDRAGQSELRAALAAIDDLITAGSVELRLGEHNVSDFTTADLIIANPAVKKPWSNRFLRAASAAGIPITSEIRLTIERHNRNRIIGVTGSAGKSTTAAMIHHLLTRAGLRSHLGGNIGGSLLPLLARQADADGNVIEVNDWIVLELSSAMLHWLGGGLGFVDAPAWSPHLAVITNISPNHIDWHESFEHYRESKLNITRAQAQAAGDAVFLPRDMIGGEAVAHAAGSEVRFVDTRTDGEYPGIDLAIPGRHNLENARLAIAVASQAVAETRGVESDGNPDDIKADCAHALRDFHGLPHRLQLIAEVDGRLFFNDSKSTTPAATLLAVDAFPDASRVHLIAGGSDKGVDLSPISALRDRIAGLYTIGATSPTIAQHAGTAANIFPCETLECAVRQAWDTMKAGDILLLSPGCASFDQFANFEARGEAFISLVVEKLAHERDDGEVEIKRSAESSGSSTSIGTPRA